MGRERKMVAFRLSARAQQLVAETAEALTAAGPVAVNKTDVMEMAIDEWCRKKLERLRRRLDNVKTDARLEEDNASPGLETPP